MDGPVSLDFTDPMLGTIRRLFPPIQTRDIQFFLALLAIDGVFVILHASHVRYDQPDSGLWLLSRDRGFSELWQYLKEGVIVLLLLGSYRRERSAVHLAWATTFGYFLIDDSLEIHETVGEAVADGLGLGQTFGIEGRDVGQILVSGSVGLVLLGAIAATTMVDRTPARGLTMRLLPVLLAIGFFGVVADVVDVIDVLGLVEDGGEMVAMTLAVAVVAEHWRRRTAAPATGPVSTTAAPVTGKRT